MTKEIFGSLGTNHNITINNQIQQEIGHFLDRCNVLVDKNAMVHITHQEAVQKDLAKTLDILNTESEKIGVTPGELIEEIDGFTQDKPIARGFAALTFNINEMMFFSPDFLYNITSEIFDKMMVERVQQSNPRIDKIREGFSWLQNITYPELMHDRNIESIRQIYKKCLSNIQKIQDKITKDANTVSEKIKNWIRDDIKRWRENYQWCGWDELDEALQKLYTERNIGDNDMIDIIEWVVMIYFFNRDHPIKKKYNTVLLEQIWNFMAERANRFGWDFYDDFKYLRQEYSSTLLMYDSDYAIYEHALVIQQEIEKLLEKHRLYIMR